MVKNLPFNAGDMGLIPGQGTKIPHTAGRLSPHTETTEPECSRAHTPQPRPSEAIKKKRNKEKALPSFHLNRLKNHKTVNNSQDCL